MTKKLSIIIPCLNEGNNVEKTVSNIKNTIGLNDYEIIIVNNGGTELSSARKISQVRIFDVAPEGAPQAKNFGAKQADGEVLLIIDGHLTFKEGWGLKFLDVVDEKTLLNPTITVDGKEGSRGSGQTWRNFKMDITWMPDSKSDIHEIPFASTACLAIEKKTFDAIGQLDSGIKIWGTVDPEFSLRAWLLGYCVLGDPSIRVAHLFRNKIPYKVKLDDVTYNKIRLAFSHFNPERLVNFLQVNFSEPKYQDNIFSVLKSDVLERRSRLFNIRKHSDDWFFEKFKMEEW